MSSVDACISTWITEERISYLSGILISPGGQPSDATLPLTQGFIRLRTPDSNRSHTTHSSDDDLKESISDIDQSINQSIIDKHA